MDIILILLLIIILILGFINIYKDSYETFQQVEYSCNPSSGDHCKSLKIDTNKDTDTDIKDYTLSLIFQNPPISNTVQYLLSYGNNWEIYILKNILYLSDPNDPNNYTSITLTKPKNTLQQFINNNSSVFHMALIAQKQSNNTQLFLFLNGLDNSKSIKINSNRKTYSDLTKIFIGQKNKEDTDTQFTNVISNLEFFPEYKTDTELCKKWESCNCDYSLQNNITSNKKECEEDCKSKNSCTPQQCKETCKNWKPLCKYEPTGNSLDVCKKTCEDDLTNSCRYDECHQKCTNCDSNICPWNKRTDSRQTQELDKTNLDCTELLPPNKLVFNIKSKNSLTIKWEHPKLYDGDKYDERINMFLFIISKTNKRNEGQQIITKTIDEKWIEILEEYNVNKDKIHLYKQTKWSPFHELTLDNLNDNEYTIYCKSVIKGGKPCKRKVNTEEPEENTNTNKISDPSIFYNINFNNLINPFLKDKLQRNQ